MTTGHESNEEIRTDKVHKRWIAITALVTVLICSLVSWILVSSLTVPKSVYASDLTDTSNAIGHLQDATNGLDSYASYQTTTVQIKLASIDAQISDITNQLNNINADLVNNASDHTTFAADIASIKARLDSLTSSMATLDASVGTINTSLSSLTAKVTALDTAINDASTGLKTSVSALTTAVNAIGGLQVVPTIVTTTGGGTISLSINSTQNATTQVMAFSVEFRMKAGNDVPLYATMDASLAALYNTPIVSLKLGSNTTVVPSDHIKYNLYWDQASGKYHLGSVTFLTTGTSITKGVQTKTLVYTCAGVPVYDIVVTPEPAAAIGSSGTAIVTW